MRYGKMLAALAMGAVAGCVAEGPPQVVERRIDPAPAARGPDLLRRAMLDGHAAVRTAVGAPPLIWSDALAADAAAYADELARTRRFAHSPSPRGNPVQGENLWMGTRGAFTFAEMVGHWAAERAYYRTGPIPDVSTSGRFEDVGHYTQMIWRRTTTVGCAVASSAGEDYLVCRYLPAGNVVGRTPSD